MSIRDSRQTVIRQVPGARSLRQGQRSTLSHMEHKTELFHALRSFSKQSALITKFQQDYPSMRHDDMLKISKSLLNTFHEWKNNPKIYALFGFLLQQYVAQHVHSISNPLIYTIVLKCGIQHQIIHQTPMILCLLTDAQQKSFLQGVSVDMLMDCLERLESAQSCKDQIVNAIIHVLPLKFHQGIFQFMSDHDLFPTWIRSIRQKVGIDPFIGGDIDAFIRSLPEGWRDAILKERHKDINQCLSNVDRTLQPVVRKLEQFQFNHGQAPYNLKFKLNHTLIEIHLFDSNVQLSVQIGYNDRPYLIVDSYFMGTGLQNRKKIPLNRQQIFEYLKTLAIMIGCYMMVIGLDIHSYKVLSLQKEFPSRGKDIFCRNDMMTFYQRAIPGMTIVSNEQMEHLIRNPRSGQVQQIRRKYITLRKRIRQNAHRLLCKDVSQILPPGVASRQANQPEKTFLTFLHELCQSNDDDTLADMINHFKQILIARSQSGTRTPSNDTLNAFLDDLSTILFDTRHLVLNLDNQRRHHQTTQ